MPVTRQDAFEAPPLRPLRYLSGSVRHPRIADSTLVAVLGEHANTSLYLPCRWVGQRRHAFHRLPPLAEKLLDEVAAFRFQNTAGDTVNR